MSESTRKKIVFMALFVAIVWGVYNYLPSSKRPLPDVSQPSLAGIPAPMSKIPAAGALEKSINIAEMKNKHWGEDPFRGETKKAIKSYRTKKPVWKLSGIVYSNSRPLAIINGRPVTVGKVLSGAKVEKIERKKVTLKYAGENIVLTISKR